MASDPQLPGSEAPYGRESELPAATGAEDEIGTKQMLERLTALDEKVHRMNFYLEHVLENWRERCGQQDSQISSLEEALQKLCGRIVCLTEAIEHLKDVQRVRRGTWDNRWNDEGRWHNG